MSEYYKSYRIKYDVHCKFQNFFNKEMLIKNCMSELHAKMKLGVYCEKKYKEFDHVKFKSVEEENDIMKGFEDIFGKGFGDKKDISIFNDLLKNSKKKDK